MRIGFNGFFLGQEGTGSGQYTHHLLHALAQVSRGDEYLLYARAGSRHSAMWSAHELRTPFTWRFDNLDKVWFEQIAFPRVCRQAAVDVCHVPYFASPLFPTSPTVVTVHDLIPLLLPAYRGSLLVRLYTQLVAAAARRANQIITDSLASKNDIIKHLRVPARRVHVIYLAVDSACRRISGEKRLGAVRRKYGLPEEYVLYLGGFDQRKNLRTMLHAYQHVLQVIGDATPALVVAGRLPSVETPLFPNPQRMARELGIEQHVLFIGWVAEEDKPALYSGARFFVFLSLYEGFGLMLLEAMSCGTPVLAANSSSLPEIVGDSGLLVNPTDLDEISTGMLNLLQDAALRERLGETALVQAAKFDWKRTAEQTRRVYELALGSDSAGFD